MLDSASAPPSARQWQQGAMWRVVSRSPQIAVGLPLVLATIGAVASAAGWNLAGRLFLTDDARNSLPIASVAPLLERWPGDRSEGPVHRHASRFLPDAFGVGPADPITAMPVIFTAPLLTMASCDLSLGGWTYLLIGFCWSVFIWAIFGCAISRIAILQFTWDRKLELDMALQFARRKLGQHMAAVLTPLLGVFTLGVPIMLLGLCMRLGLGAAFGGLLWGGALALSLFTSVFAIGLLVGWPLIWGALAAEDSDAFDAMSRAYAYAFQAAPRYAAYILVAAVVGLLGWLLVWGFSETVVTLTNSMAAFGMGADRFQQLTSSSDPNSLTGLDRFASGCIFFWQAVWRSVASGYAFAFFWTAFGGIYLLLRYDVESAPFDAVNDDDDDAADGPGLVNSP